MMPLSKSRRTHLRALGDAMGVQPEVHWSSYTGGFYGNVPGLETASGSFLSSVGTTHVDTPDEAADLLIAALTRSGVTYVAGATGVARRELRWAQRIDGWTLEGDLVEGAPAIVIHRDGSVREPSSR